MVFINRQAKIDLDNIFIGMLEWNKIYLSVEFAEKYIDALVEQCYTLENEFYHANTTYASHKQFGKKVHKYRRNANTMWYIIYNIDSYKNIYINKIFSNHLTK